MEKQAESVVEGLVSAIVFHSGDTNFTVLEVEAAGEEITVVGEMVEPAEGEEIRAHGVYATHPTYGRQLRASAIERILPATSGAILRYLSGGAIKGIGPAIAKRLVDRFGDETIEIMERDPLALASVKGISRAKAEEIAGEFKRMMGIRTVMLFLSRHGIDPSTSIAVWKKWGGLAQEIVSADPYCLCCQEIGVAFEVADEMAGELGFLKNDYLRIKGGVLHILRHNLSNGHSCLPERKVVETCSNLLSVSDEPEFCDLPAVSAEEVEETLAALQEGMEIVREEFGGVRYLYLPEQYDAETYAAGRLSMLISLKGMDKPVDGGELDGLEQELSIRYASLQRRAIETAVAENVMILTGGPGTGKTTTLNGIITLFERRGMKVALAAPTGRAAKRLSEVTGREAKTIHRLLEVDFGQDKHGAPRFKRNDQNPLQVDVVVVDEMSMVDLVLFRSLLRAVRMGCRLVLVGDPDQLPSVGAGNVLGDLIASGKVACVHLSEVFRQAAQSLIVVSAHEIVSGRLPDLSQKSSDFFFMPRGTSEQAAQTITDLCVRRLPQAYGYSPARDIQVISPTRNGAAGTVELNRLLQEALNPADPQKGEYRMGASLLREGDKVMQVKNNYDIVWEKPDKEEGMGIFNGDIGTVELIDKPSRSILIRFDERLAQYTFDMAGELDLAYAITVHKSQGNEFDAVVIPVLGRHRRLHYRNLLYTAVTRAKKLLILVGHPRTVEEMVLNDKKTLRYTNLSELLRQGI